MKIEKIVWMDSGFSHDDGWQSIVNIMKDWSPTKLETISVGIVAYEDDDVVGLSLTHSPSTDAYIGVMLIWKKSILTREVLVNDVDQQLPG